MRVAFTPCFFLISVCEQWLAANFTWAELIAFNRRISVGVVV